MRDIQSYFRAKLQLVDSINVINRFRKRYHQGEPERLVPPKLFLSLSEKYKNSPMLSYLPKDIELFRLENYGELTYHLPLVWGFSVPTWTLLDNWTISVTMRIFNNSAFLSLDNVYFSIWSTGEEMYIANPDKIAGFMKSSSRPTNVDY